MIDLDPNSGAYQIKILSTQRFDGIKEEFANHKFFTSEATINGDLLKNVLYYDVEVPELQSLSETEGYYGITVHECTKDFEEYAWSTTTIDEVASNFPDLSSILKK